MRLRFAFVVSALVFAGFSVGRADLIEMKTGQKIEGDVLKETADALLVDVGFDILRIPLDKIRSRTKPGEKDHSNGGADANAGEVEKKAIYSTAKLPVKSVKDLAEEFGEGVVLVQTPGGLGSGFIINDRGFCVTNYHVVEQETRIAVTIYHRAEQGEFTRRRIDDVKILALNPFFDLALLQIPKQEDFGFQPVYLSRDSDYKEGDEVFAIGNPLGLERLRLQRHRQHPQPQLRGRGLHSDHCPDQSRQQRRPVVQFAGRSHRGDQHEAHLRRGVGVCDSGGLSQAFPRQPRRVRLRQRQPQHRLPLPGSPPAFGRKIGQHRREVDTPTP